MTERDKQIEYICNKIDFLSDADRRNIGQILTCAGYYDKMKDSGQGIQIKIAPIDDKTLKALYNRIKVFEEKKNILI